MTTLPCPGGARQRRHLLRGCESLDRAFGREKKIAMSVLEHQSARAKRSLTDRAAGNLLPFWEPTVTLTRDICARILPR